MIHPSGLYVTALRIENRFTGPPELNEDTETLAQVALEVGGTALDIASKAALKLTSLPIFMELIRAISTGKVTALVYPAANLVSITFAPLRCWDNCELDSHDLDDAQYIIDTHLEMWHRELGDAILDYRLALFAPIQMVLNETPTEIIGTEIIYGSSTGSLPRHRLYQVLSCDIEELKTLLLGQLEETPELHEMLSKLRGLQTAYSTANESLSLEPGHSPDCFNLAQEWIDANRDV